jgi:hypothetical protein
MQWSLGLRKQDLGNIQCPWPLKVKTRELFTESQATNCKDLGLVYRVLDPNAIVPWALQN